MESLESSHPTTLEHQWQRIKPEKNLGPWTVSPAQSRQDWTWYIDHITNRLINRTADQITVYPMTQIGGKQYHDTDRPETIAVIPNTAFPTAWAQITPRKTNQTKYQKTTHISYKCFQTTSSNSSRGGKNLFSPVHLQLPQLPPLCCCLLLHLKLLLLLGNELLDELLLGCITAANASEPMASS